MRGVVLLFAAVMMVNGTGCAGRKVHPELPSLMVPVSCASEITLVGCDARVTPPKCRSARVTYRRGCEEIVLGK